MSFQTWTTYTLPYNGVSFRIRVLSVRISKRSMLSYLIAYFLVVKHCKFARYSTTAMLAMECKYE
jgi:hypothetical protein